MNKTIKKRFRRKKDLISRKRPMSRRKYHRKNKITRKIMRGGSEWGYYDEDTMINKYNTLDESEKKAARAIMAPREREKIDFLLAETPQGKEDRKTRNENLLTAIEKKKKRMSEEDRAKYLEKQTIEQNEIYEIKNEIKKKQDEIKRQQIEKQIEQGKQQLQDAINEAIKKQEQEREEEADKRRQKESTPEYQAALKKKTEEEWNAFSEKNNKEYNERMNLTSDQIEEEIIKLKNEREQHEKKINEREEERIRNKEEKMKKKISTPDNTSIIKEDCSKLIEGFQQNVCEKRNRDVQREYMIKMVENSAAKYEFTPLDANLNNSIIAKIDNNEKIVSDQISETDNLSEADLEKKIKLYEGKTTNPTREEMNKYENNKNELLAIEENRRALEKEQTQYQYKRGEYTNKPKNIAVGVEVRSDPENAGIFLPGKIIKLNTDGTFDVEYNNGNVETNLNTYKIKPTLTEKEEQEETEIIKKIAEINKKIEITDESENKLRSLKYKILLYEKNHYPTKQEQDEYEKLKTEYETKAEQQKLLETQSTNETNEIKKTKDKIKQYEDDKDLSQLQGQKSEYEKLKTEYETKEIDREKDRSEYEKLKYKIQKYKERFSKSEEQKSEYEKLKKRALETQPLSPEETKYIKDLKSSVTLFQRKNDDGTNAQRRYKIDELYTIYQLVNSITTANMENIKKNIKTEDALVQGIIDSNVGIDSSVDYGTNYSGLVAWVNNPVPTNEKVKTGQEQGQPGQSEEQGQGQGQPEEPFSVTIPINFLDDATYVDRPKQNGGRNRLKKTVKRSHK